MSKLSEYSKFDHIDDNSSDEDDELHNNNNNNNKKKTNQKPPSLSQPNDAQSAVTTTEAPVPAPMLHATTTNTTATTTGPRMRKNADTGRFVYEYNGKAIYEWEQKLDDVTIYIPAPPRVQSRDIHCKIFPHSIELGIKAIVEQKGQYFMREDTFGLVDVSESTWYMEDDDNNNKNMIVLFLVKAKKGEVWEVALMGNTNQQQQNGGEGTEGPPVLLDPLSKQEVQKELMLERFQEENPGFDFRGAEFNGSVPDPRTFMGGVKYS